MNRNIVSRIFIILQLIAALALTLFFIYAIAASSDKREASLSLLPQIIIMQGAAIFNISLLLKRKSQMEEGALVPLFFLLTTLEAIGCFPLVYDYTGRFFLSFSMNVRLGRFFFMSSEVTALFASIKYLKISSGKFNSYVIAALIGMLLISFIIPASSARAVDIHSGLVMGIVILIAALTDITYLIQFVKDREKNSLLRFLSFLLLLAGELILAQHSVLNSLAIGGSVFYIAGLVLFSVSTRDF